MTLARRTPDPQALAKAEVAQRAHIPVAVQEAKRLVIATQEDYDDARDFLVEVKTELRDLEAQRKTITGPLDQAKKACDALFAPYRAALSQAEGLLKTKMAAFDAEQRALHAEAWAQAEELDAAGDVAGSVQAVAVANNHAAIRRPVGSSIRQQWVVVSIDAAAVTGGRAWCMPDERAIRQAVAATPAALTPPEIPGVVVELQGKVSQRI